MVPRQTKCIMVVFVILADRRIFVDVIHGLHFVSLTNEFADRRHRVFYNLTSKGTRIC